MYLYDENQSQLNYNDDDPRVGCCCTAIYRTLDPGTYYLNAGGLGDWGTGSYDLIIEPD
jgi:hypothetical protein